MVSGVSQDAYEGVGEMGGGAQEPASPPPTPPVAKYLCVDACGQLFSTDPKLASMCHK